ncbi:hypothetical protein PLESTB_000148400 [Pleodorina starrii]|uniref:Uncharacterized protein n=1 Tax=Pleodorina starrii TaxID=330485 RepID=A0A9W6BBL5_9CHLO|nr:hypothetical protein PLESTM_000447000 [Pleodorina starrii]GLC48790.1 hypothetical protein PLESTB_000148400 [Pleodorina starrii]GLC72530.1 hypothetical protein PLESTF_001261100 [Pleodorina starrii]
MASCDAYTPELVNNLQGYSSIVAGHVAASPGVAYLELARPQRHNAFHEELWIEFPRALQQLDAHPDTRVIVVSGQGKNFCAGIDVGYLQRNFAALATAAAATAAAPAGRTGAGAAAPAGPRAADAGGAGCPGAQRAAMRRNILSLQDAYSELERCRSPVVAAVHGRCIGGGVDLITACDLRICSDDATFCVKEVDLAIAADLGTLQRLPHIVGHGAAMDLALTARTMGAPEAQRIGLVSTVVAASASGETDGTGGGGGGGRGAVVAAALRLAAALASKPQLAVQGTKRVLLHARDQPRVSDGLDYVATWNSAQLLTADLARLISGGSGSGSGSGGARPGLAARSRM